MEKETEFTTTLTNKAEWDYNKNITTVFSDHPDKIYQLEIVDYIEGTSPREWSNRLLIGVSKEEDYKDASVQFLIEDEDGSDTAIELDLASAKFIVEKLKLMIDKLEAQNV